MHTIIKYMHNVPTMKPITIPMHNTRIKPANIQCMMYDYV